MIDERVGRVLTASGNNGGAKFCRTGVAQHGHHLFLL